MSVLDRQQSGLFDWGSAIAYRCEFTLQLTNSSIKQNLQKKGINSLETDWCPASLEKVRQLQRVFYLPPSRDLANPRLPLGRNTSF